MILHHQQRARRGGYTLLMVQTSIRIAARGQPVRVLAATPESAAGILSLIHQVAEAEGVATPLAIDVRAWRQ